MVSLPIETPLHNQLPNTTWAPPPELRPMIELNEGELIISNIVYTMLPFSTLFLNEGEVLL